MINNIVVWALSLSSSLTLINYLCGLSFVNWSASSISFLLIFLIEYKSNEKDNKMEFLGCRTILNDKDCQDD